MLRDLVADINIDLLINFPLGMNIKRQHRQQLATEEQDTDHDAHYDGPTWRQLPGVAKGRRVGPAFLEHYKDLLRAKLGFQYVGDTRTVKHPAKNSSLYLLILASRHARGRDFWAKVTDQEPSGQHLLALNW